MKNLKFKNKKDKRGFTLFFAVIIISIVLAVGLTIYNIVIKQLKFSSFSRDSQMAFYAADTGIECIFYWDLKKGMISTTTPSNINCVGQSVSAGGSLVSSFNLTFDNGTCAQITIDKSNPFSTKVESRGYNICNPNDYKRLERAIRATY